MDNNLKFKASTNLMRKHQFSSNRTSAPRKDQNQRRWRRSRRRRAAGCATAMRESHPCNEFVICVQPDRKGECVDFERWEKGDAPLCHSIITSEMEMQMQLLRICFLCSKAWEMQDIYPPPTGKSALCTRLSFYYDLELLYA